MNTRVGSVARKPAGWSIPKAIDSSPITLPGSRSPMTLTTPSASAQHVEASLEDAEERAIVSFVDGELSRRERDVRHDLREPLEHVPLEVGEQLDARDFLRSDHPRILVLPAHARPGDPWHHGDPMKVVTTLVVAAVMAVAAATSTAATAKLQPGVAKLTWPQTHALQHVRRVASRLPGRAVRNLRVLTARYYGFDHRTHLGQIVVNEAVAAPLAKVFRKLYAMRFPIREMSFASMYGPHPDKNGDVTASFECRNAVPSPCNGNATGTHWSMHAYGEAVDLDPRENPYVGCGMTRDKTALSYMKRRNVRPGMVTPAIYRETFAKIGWGWGGLWAGSTKDYMHLSINGH